MPVELNPALPQEGLPTEEEVQVNAEETAAPIPGKGGEEADPQAKAELGEEELEQEEHPKRKGGWQRRIEKQDKELEFLRDQNRDLLARFAPHQAKAEATSDMPDPEKFSGTIEEYKTALKAWNETQIVHAKQQAARELRIERFGEALNDLPEEIWDQAEKLEIHPELGNFLADKLSGMKNGKEVYVALVNHPDIIDEYKQMDGYQIVASLSAISHQLRFAPPSTPAAKEDKPRVTRAPAPPTPVSRATSADKELRDDLPFEDWVNRREAQIKGK